MELLWRVELENGATVTGSTLMQPGENRIVCELPDDTLKSAFTMISIFIIIS